MFVLFNFQHLKKLTSIPLYGLIAVFKKSENRKHFVLQN